MKWLVQRQPRSPRTPGRSRDRRANRPRRNASSRRTPSAAPRLHRSHPMPSPMGCWERSTREDLPTTYTEQEARERLFPTVVRGVHVLQCARVAGWLTACEFAEELHQVSTRCDAAAALTSTTPSPAGGSLGAPGATASAKGTEYLCGPSPTPLRDVPCAQVPTTSTTAHPVDQVRSRFRRALLCFKAPREGCAQHRLPDPR